MTQSLYRPKPIFNLMRRPLIGRFLRWRWSRLTIQSVMILVSALLIYDGFTGPPFAPENLSTVTVWIHYRGFVVFALLFAGNLFCMGCPFTVPRTLAKRLSISGRRWPKFLRNKWLAIGLLFGFLYAYELFDLFASPFLTAWIIVGYFVAAFVLEAFFAESPFCKYVCPLGTFNFASSTISPLQITVENRDVCRTCVGKECINGSTSQPGVAVTQGQGAIQLNDIQVLGCGTELFAPQIQSNLDCVFCMDCARACPHDNVALEVRNPLRETSEGAWPQRWDIAILILVFAFSGLGNAFGMVPPIFSMQSYMALNLGIESEWLSLGIILGVLNFLLPVAAGLLAAWLSRALGRRKESLRTTLSHYVPSVAPVAFGIWLAHYGGFHFLSSALSIVPVFQLFLGDHGISFLGGPNWGLGPLLPINWLDPIEVLFVLGGLIGSLVVLNQRARRREGKRASPLEQLPWLLLIIGLAAAALWIFGLPMEMRGTNMFG